jgi:hypothetical protein
VLILEHQLEITEPCSEAQSVGSSHDLREIEFLTRLIHQGETMDERPTTAIGVQTGLQLSETLRQSDKQSAPTRHLMDQQTRPPIAEGDLSDIDPIPEQIQKR